MADYTQRGFNQFLIRETFKKIEPFLPREIDILIGEISGAKIIDYQADKFNYTPTVASSTPKEGEMYYDKETKKIRVYTGSSFETITSS